MRGLTVLGCALLSGLLLMHATPWAAESTPAVNLVGRPVPQIDSLPEGPYRELVLQGRELSTRTFAVIGPEVKTPRQRYAGNNLACTSCHQEGGAKPFAIPWVGVTATFPQYRGREDRISTVEERINGCMDARWPIGARPTCRRARPVRRQIRQAPPEASGGDSP